VVKFFLNVSKEEQRKRFLERLEEPEKFWKFSAADVRERAYWSAYMSAYQDALRHTSTRWAPWYVVPADHKWFTRLAVAEILVDTLDDLKAKFPKVPKGVREEFAQLKKELGG
jgi:polyphosphate kinase 2 (PPK2 family)